MSVIDAAYAAEGTPASEAGLLPGDVVASIDGTPVVTLDLVAMREMLRHEAGTRLVLSIVRDGVPLDVTLVLRELLWRRA